MFKKAVRKSVKLKLAITGPTGSGKTYSALRLAKGLSGKVAVIDTENGSASLYSDKFEFDVMDMTPPFTTEKYIEAINFAEKNGYDTIIIDSLTHAWAGEGGLLEQKALLDRPGTNQWANWKPIDKKDNELKNAFLHSSCHIIATMRSKMEYMQTEDNGKKKVEKVGLAPVQRDGLTYDFTIVFDVAMDHLTQVSKDRTGIFADKIFKISEDTGETIKKWIESGAANELERSNAGSLPGPPTAVAGISEPAANPGNRTAEKTIEIKPPNERPVKETSSVVEEKIKTPITQEMVNALMTKLEMKGKCGSNFYAWMNKEYGTRFPINLKTWQYVEIMDILDGNR
jgi:hypothetical protein